MALAIVHFRSRKQIPVLHPWTAREWMDWIAADRYGSYADKSACMVVIDEKGNQYAICSLEVEFVMVVPNPEGEDDGK